MKLIKFLRVPKLSHFPGRDPDPAKRPVWARKPEETGSSALRIVHAGGKVEIYFMAIPAFRIMEKYPSHVVTRPEIFRRPWDSVVNPNEILALGRKYYVVPRHTVKKLRRRMLKPGSNGSNDTKHVINSSYVLKSLNDVSIDSENEAFSTSSIDTSDVSDMSGGFRARRRKNGMKKRVRFKGIEENLMQSSSTALVAAKKPYNKQDQDENNTSKELRQPQAHSNVGGKRNTKYSALTWQPSLAAITESHGLDG